MPRSAKTDPASQADEKTGRRPLVRIAILIVLVAGTASVAVVYWQDRQLHRIEQALDRGETRQAYELATAYLVDHPDSSRAQALLARVYVARGQAMEALRIFDEVGPATTADMHALGQAYLMLQRWSDAHLLLTRVIEAEPNNADGLYEISSCRVRLGKFEEALESANRLAQIPGSETQGYLFVGTIQSDLRNFEQAAEAYAEVVKHEPKGENLEVRPDEFFLWYGRALLHARQPSAAVEQIQRSIDVLPAAAAYLELGNAYLEAGDTDRAVAAWEDACARDPIAQDARQSLANIAMQDGDAKLALRWLKPLEDNPNLRSTTAYLIQRAHTMLEHEEEALAWQQRTETLRKREQVEDTIAGILIDNPNSFWAHVIRAHRFAANGNWEEAQAIVEPLAARTPVDPFVADLAQAIRQRGTLPPIDRIPLIKF